MGLAGHIGFAFAQSVTKALAKGLFDLSELIPGALSRFGRFAGFERLLGGFLVDDASRFVGASVNRSKDHSTSSAVMTTFVLAAVLVSTSGSSSWLGSVRLLASFKTIMVCLQFRDFGVLL